MFKQAFVLLLLSLSMAQAAYAYEPQISVGLSASQREEVIRYGASLEFYNENIMIGNFLGLWPRLEMDSETEQHALFLNAFTLAGIVNLEYGYTTGYGHSYGVEINSRFIPAVFIPILSANGDRLARSLEVFFRMHRPFTGSGSFYQTGLKLVFHFPGFKFSDEI